jgi:hypothetical protein
MWPISNTNRSLVVESLHLASNNAGGAVMVAVPPLAFSTSSPSHATISNSTFDNNRYITDLSYQQLEFANCGAAVGNFDVLHIAHSSFSNSRGLPALSIQSALRSGTVLLEHLSITGHQILKPWNSSAVVLQVSGDTLISNSRFDNNKAYNGGALSLSQTILPQPTNITISQSTFTNNNAQNTGGAVYAFRGM